MITVKEIISVLVEMASTFYILAASIVIIQCFFDNGIVWTRKKTFMLVGLLLVSRLADLIVPDSTLVSLITVLSYIIIPIFDCRKRVIRRALNVAGTYFTMAFCSVCILLIAFSYLMPNYDVHADLTDTEDFLISLITAMVFGAVYHYLDHRIIKRGLFIPCGKKEKFIIFFYVIFVMSTSMIISVSDYANGSWSRSVQVLMAVISILFMLIMPIFIFHSRISDSYRRMYEYQETYLEAELEHFRRYKLAQEETARFRHDIRNNLVCLDELLATGRTAEASSYLESLLDEVRALSPAYVSGDEVLDCIISAKAATMEQSGISFTLDGVIAGGLDWKAIDVCSVFANALDNAMEACVLLPSDQRRITMSLRSTDRMRFIRIENPAAKPVDVSRLFSEKGGYTTKTTSANHGIGTYNMKRTVEKYGGIIRAEYENGIFALELIINR